MMMMMMMMFWQVNQVMFCVRCRVSETVQKSCHSSEVGRLHQSAARTERIYFRTKLRRYSAPCDYVQAHADVLLVSKHVPFSIK